MEDNYEKYKKDVTEDIKSCLENMGCQPILFIGSGLSKRYIDSPNWEELLIELSKQCPLIDKKFAYYKQKFNDNIEIGSIFSEKFNDWAWEVGETEFPAELFEPSVPPESYFKYKVSRFFEEILPEDIKNLSQEKTREIEKLKSIRPHSVITTNYDRLLELIFPLFEPIIGQKILRTSHASIGEIFKIHGCSSIPMSINITKDDYDDFVNKKKYLSAKLLTYFAEHPLLFVGYSAEDPNIRSILADIDEILSEKNELIPNIYILEWKKETPTSSYPIRERIIPTINNKSVRIKSITATDFSWVFDAFSSNSALEHVNPKLLRSLLARTYKLVRSDIPKNPVQVDYSILGKVTENDGELAKLYGIANAGDGTAFNINYPFTLSALGKALGYKGWHDANKLLEHVRNMTGTDLKSFDNIYHCAIMSGSRVQDHRYSAALKSLLEKVRDGQEFKLETT